MKIIGLTGGIGSGKTLVVTYWQNKGFPVYNSDSQAKTLMNSSPEIKEKLIQLFGEAAYISNTLNRNFIAKEVFSNPNLLQKLNAIVHPIVQLDFDHWKAQQTAKYVVKETAILFETGIYKQCDYIVTVTAEENIRIKRVMQRDRCTKNEVLQRIQNQWAETKKIALSDYVLYNNTTIEHLYTEVEKLITHLEM